MVLGTLDISKHVLCYLTVKPQLGNSQSLYSNNIFLYFLVLAFFVIFVGVQGLPTSQLSLFGRVATYLEY